MATSKPCPDAKNGSVVSDDEATVLNPGLNDVVCGRGGHTIDCNANVRFRSLVGTYKDRYTAASKKQKASVAIEIVRRWRSSEPRGGFLAKTDPSLGDASPWRDIGHKKAVMKTLQCLRERAGPSKAQALALFKNTSSRQQAPTPGYPHYPVQQSPATQSHFRPPAAARVSPPASLPSPTASAPVPSFMQTGTAPPTMMPNLFARTSPSLSASSSRNSSLSSASLQNQQQGATVNATFTPPLSAPPTVAAANNRVPAPNNVQLGQAMATVLQAALACQAQAAPPVVATPPNNHSNNTLQLWLVQELAKVLGGTAGGTPAPLPPLPANIAMLTQPPPPPPPRAISPSSSSSATVPVSNQPSAPPLPMAMMAALTFMMSAASAAAPTNGFQYHQPPSMAAGTITPPAAAAASTNPPLIKPNLTPEELTTVIQLLTTSGQGDSMVGQQQQQHPQSIPGTSVSAIDIQRVLALGKIMTGVAARGN